MNNTASTADQTPAYLNGSYLPLSQASISPLDRGFIFGDGVYEVIPVYGRKPFRLEGHLQRLESSLRGIRLPNPHTREQWGQIIDGVIEEAGARSIADLQRWRDKKLIEILKVSGEG